MDLSQVNEQLSLITSRLDTIEAKLNIVKLQSIPAIPAEPLKTSVQTAASAPQTVTESSLSKSFRAGNLLGIVAIICFIVAAGFIIKLSIDSGWLTPVRQIGLAAMLGFSLIVSGLVLFNYDKEYASLLPGAGIIILYVTTFAAYREYALFSYDLALGLLMLISGFCLYLNIRLKQDIYSIVAVIGTYAGPLLLGFNTTSIFSLYYFILCSCTFVAIAVWMRSRLIMLIGAFLAVITTAIVGFDLNQNNLIAFTLAMHFLIYSVGVLYFSYKNKSSLNADESWGFFVVLVLFYATEYYFLSIGFPKLAPWLSLAFAAVLIVLYQTGKIVFPGQYLNSGVIILAFSTIVFFHSIYLELLPHQIRAWLFVVIFLCFSVLPLRFMKVENQKKYLIPIIAISLILGIEYISMIYHMIDGYDISWIIVTFASVMSIWIALLLKPGYITRKEESGYIVLSVAHFLAIAGCYRLFTDYGSLAVSCSWLLYALCVIGFAFLQKDKIMANSALFVLGIAAAKALLYDVSGQPTLVRILCLLLTGLVLFGSGFLMKYIAAWDKAQIK